MKHGSDLAERARLLDQNQSGPQGPVGLVRLDNFVLIARPRAGDVSFKDLPYLLSMVRDMPTKVVSDSGEGATRNGYSTSMEGSTRANYPLLARGGSDEK